MTKKPTAINKSVNLFGEETKKEKSKGLYNKYDLISYFLKSLRLGETEQALTCFWAMRNMGITEFYIAKKLVQFATEDNVGAEAVNYAWSTFGIVKEFKREENAIGRLIVYLCNAPKMWESEQEHGWELKRIQIREYTKKLLKKGKKPFELPEYVFDKYTAKGKARYKKGEQIDRRYSGVYAGSGLFMRAQYLRDGHIDPTATEMAQAYSPHLLVCLKSGMTVDNYFEAHEITAEQFLDINHPTA